MINKTNSWLKENWPIFLMFMGVGAGGTGAGFGIPYFGAVIDRMDAIIYLKCEKDNKCVDNVWDYILGEKEKSKLREGR